MDALKCGLGLISALALCWAPAAGADTGVATAVKATYLVKFAQYVAWPPSTFANPSAPINLCIVGRDPFGSGIDQAAKGERVDRHPIVVRRMASIDRNSPCHIAFVAGAVAAKALPAVEGAPILTVTDLSETRLHGLMQFDLRGGHIGFQIDDVAARRAGLDISSRLLAIAFSLTSRPAQ
ncbi:YfiR family protein [Sphingomonas sp.]|jgi:hypothetical protein|uniref:YfiR family protein n=1 Tax=Sphingomonas sp. TaxID=28214 RepID=UPI002E36A716|nr:YfiR family protein [Sphingomonas sp.]HEX4695207.1 YfiR family protein [Sphingomonas sp.]